MSPWLVREDKVAFISELLAYPDRIVGLLAPELVNEALADTIKCHWQDTDDGSLFGQLFRDGGQLGSFATRIHIGFAMRLYGKDTYSDLKILNKVRNEFAHNVFAKDFQFDAVKSRINRLVLPDKYPVWTAEENAAAENMTGDAWRRMLDETRAEKNAWRDEIAWAKWSAIGNPTDLRTRFLRTTEILSVFFVGEQYYAERPEIAAAGWLRKSPRF